MKGKQGTMRKKLVSEEEDSRQARTGPKRGEKLSLTVTLLSDISGTKNERERM